MTHPDSSHPPRTAPSAADPAEPAGTQDGASGEQNAEPLPDTVARLTGSDLDSGERRRLLGRLASSASGGTRRGFRRFVATPRAATRWTLDTLIEIAPHLPVRDLDTLRRHFDGRSGDALAEVLIRNSSRITAGIGAAGGGVAAVEWAAPPTLLSAPVLIAAETVAVVAVEVKLIAELHEAYGMPIQGSVTEKGTQLLGAWAQRRGVSLLNPARGLSAVLSVGMRKELRERLLKRMGRNLTTLGPLFTGAAVAAELNRRATKSLGEQVRDDLRKTARRQLPPGR